MFNLMNFYMILGFIYMFIMFLYYYINQIVMFVEFELIKINSMKFEMLILIDWISLLFISVVMMISVMVIYYSFEYMDSDVNINRFIMLVYLFIISMILMIISPNMVSILLGWDGLGLVSYCLVIYYQSNKSFNSGMVTVLTNRIGDILILMSISMMVMFGSWNYMFLYKMSNYIYFMLMVASFTKSAQLPFSSWLPLAMAAPTPVSSLVHSSTLVTAGVYLMIRLNYLLESDYLKFLMMMISLITMLLAGVGANFEFDLKKIIALSTLSQLGLMFFCLSMNLMEITMFHLLTHAMFKSMLFMCAGIIIHMMGGNQDIRLISMTLYNLPLVSMMFNCASMSLCGIPFLSGFYSKDLILELYLMNYLNMLIFSLLFISMGLTVMYSIRLMYYSFMKIPQLMIYFKYLSYESNMGMSMYLLFFFSNLGGLILSWILFSSKNFIFLTMKLKLLIFLFMLIGMLMGYWIPQLMYQKKLLIYLNQLMLFFLMLWYMPILYTFLVNQFLNFIDFLFYSFEVGWNEFFSGFMFFSKYIYYMNKWNFIKKNFNNLLILFMIVVVFYLF